MQLFGALFGGLFSDREEQGCREPEKKRRVCRLPKSIHFYAAGAEKEHGITMTVEEYEIRVRVIDHLAFTQEECAARMQVSRATVQYRSTREPERSWRGF